MTRRRGQSPAISLFAFQDIITSVTGILVFLTLMLALELLDRQNNRPGTSTAFLTEALRESVQRAAQERDLLTEKANRVNRALSRVAEYSSHEMEREDRENKQSLGQIQAKSHLLDNRLQEISRLQTAAEAKSFDRRTDREALTRLRAEIERLKEKADQDAERNTVHYRFARGTHREGWLVEVGANRIAVVPLGREAGPVLFEREAGPLAELLRGGVHRDFLRWVEDGRSSVYYLFVIRPSGIGEFQHIESAFRGAGRKFGLDLIGEDQTAIGPQQEGRLE